MAVFVIDQRKHPLMPCSEKRARLLLERGRARVHKLIPFTIRLVDRCVTQSELQPLELKIDPGSDVSGIALVRNHDALDTKTGEVTSAAHVLNLFELVHRSAQISKELTARRLMRRRRRSANLRYRVPRFLNRKNQGQGWLPPSLQHRVDNVLSWITRLRQLAPITHLAQELVPLDTKQLTIYATRHKLFNNLTETHLIVRSGLRSLTKLNRDQFNLPDTPALDAVCVGDVNAVEQWQKPTLVIKATGRGSYQRTRLDRFGFPRGYLMQQKQIHGFQTGDMVKAVVTKGKKIGTYVGRVAVRASGNFNIQTGTDVVQGIGHRYFTLIQRGDGYGYSFRSKST